MHPKAALLRRYTLPRITARGRTLITLGLIPLYALCFVAIKAGLPFAPPLQFAGLRLLVAGLGLLAVVGMLGHSLRLPRRLWGWVVVLALSAGSFGYGTMFLSPGRAGAGLASVLGNTQPLAVMLLAAALLGERLTREKVVALVLGLVGIVLIAATALADFYLTGLVGAFLALASAVGFAVGSIIIKRMVSQDILLTITAWQFLLGSVPLLGASALVERGTPVIWNGTFIAVLLFLALAGTALTTTVWYWLVQFEDVSRLSLYLFLVPVFGVVFAFLFFAEPITILEIGGIALTIAAVGSSMWGEHHATPST